MLLLGKKNPRSLNRGWEGTSNLY